MAKQIAITMQRCEEQLWHQTWDRPADAGGDPLYRGPWRVDDELRVWRVDDELRVYYIVTKMKNAAIVKWDNKAGVVIKVGAEFDEKTADAISRCSFYDVTITQ